MNGNGRRVILCVDDEKIVLDSLEAVLSRNFGREFYLEFAESAREALEIIEDLESADLRLHAIITDWLMPDMRGDELLIRVHGGRSGVRTIMLSGQADPDAIRRVQGTDCLDFFIYKPWDEHDLISKISA